MDFCLVCGTQGGEHTVNCAVAAKKLPRTTKVEEKPEFEVMFQGVMLIRARTPQEAVERAKELIPGTVGEISAMVRN
jgi:hypothetical protein